MTCVDMIARTRAHPRVVLAGVLVGVCLGVGIPGVFALYGFLPLAVGAAIAAWTARRLGRAEVIELLVVTVLVAAMTDLFLLWGSEYVWSIPSCAQHPGQQSGEIIYWSGAKVDWTCTNGKTVVTRDTRPFLSVILPAASS